MKTYQIVAVCYAAVLLLIIVVIIVVIYSLTLPNDGPVETIGKKIQMATDTIRENARCALRDGIFFAKDVIEEKRERKCAFVFTGKLRTWKSCMPRWHETFRRLQPDVYLFLNEQNERPSMEEYRAVLGPDVDIKMTHYWTKQDMDRFEEEYWIKIKDVEKEMKSKIDEPQVYREFDPEKRYSIQFYQLQKAFRMIDFSRYDIVIKGRLDVVMFENKQVRIDSDWTRINEVAPYFFRDPNPRDHLVAGRTESFLRTGEGKTLGGAYVINRSEEYGDIERHRVVWMLNDHVYWSTGKNMQRFHQDIYDRYGSYITAEYPFSWTNESTIIFHAKRLGMQPLMILATEYVR